MSLFCNCRKHTTIPWYDCTHTVPHSSTLSGTVLSAVGQYRATRKNYHATSDDQCQGSSELLSYFLPDFRSSVVYYSARTQRREGYRKRRVREGGEENKLPCGGRAWPAGQGTAWKRFCWRRKEAPRTWVAKEGVADMETLEVFNKLVTRRTPADLSSTEHLTVLNKDPVCSDGC